MGSLRAWLWDGSGPNWPRVLLVSLACVVLVAVGVAGATSETAFGPYNPSWDGATDLRGEIGDTPGVEQEFVSDTRRYREVDPERTVAFVIAPDRRYGPESSDRVRQFVAGGGTLVVLENFGQSGNDLLRTLGSEARFDGDILRDERRNYLGPHLPVATGVGNHTLTAGVEQLTLNYATAVRPGNATVLVTTSPFAYLVDEPDQELDDDDELAASPVATIESLGDGSVVAIGDPSITINAMLERPDNAAFLEGLYTRGDRVILDLSHNEGLPPLTGAVLTLRASPLRQALVGGAGILGVFLVAGRRVRPAVRRLLARLPVTRSGRPPEAESVMGDAQRVAYLRQRHPDWDDERIRRVIAVLNRHDRKQEDSTNE